ncbi:MAG: alpha/beta hydrolase [Dysgonamonadaceae bacterium]|jgi:pimeloyl-ACP methyl ester carboxylesterase|nr:alpha/beta hydrolase [Dysgonamonadaceae bacterium]
MKKIILFVFALSAVIAGAQPANSLFSHTAGKYLEINGANIYYEEIENPGKPVLLFLHGGFGSIEDFNIIVPPFTAGFHIIGIDSRGHGKSTLGTDRLNYERLQSDIESVLRHLRVSEVSVIGFSDGGIAGYRLAAANPGLVKKLITVGGSWSLNDAALIENLMAGITPETCREMFARNFEFYQKNNPQPDFDRLAKCAMEMWFDKSEAGYPDTSVSAISAPVLIVRGNDDEMFPLESAVELTQKIKNALLFNIPFAPHRAFGKYPEVFVTVATEFLMK